MEQMIENKMIEAKAEGEMITKNINFTSEVNPTCKKMHVEKVVELAHAATRMAEKTLGACMEHIFQEALKNPDVSFTAMKAQLYANITHVMNCNSEYVKMRIMQQLCNEFPSVADKYQEVEVIEAPSESVVSIKVDGSSDKEPEISKQ